jgi:hypothetical protein
VEGRLQREAYRHGGIDDGWEETPYKKPGRSNWNGRKKRPCKKSKTGEVCDNLATKVKGTERIYDIKTREYIGNKPRVIRCCSRCGKEDWSYYSWW